MSEGLTLEILNKAIALIEQMEKEHEIIGFVLHPSDIRDIRDGKVKLFNIDKNKITMTPPYWGLALYESNFVPPGHPIPIRRNEWLVNKAIEEGK